MKQNLPAVRELHRLFNFLRKFQGDNYERQTEDEDISRPAPIHGEWSFKHPESREKRRRKRGHSGCCH